MIQGTSFYMHTHTLYMYVGYGCELHDNPSDHFLDIITTCEEESKTGEFSKRRHGKQMSQHMHVCNDTYACA